MAITTEQREARRRYIGSSDMPAIAGVDPFKSALGVFLEKVFEVKPLPNKGQLARGNRWEAVLLDWAEEELGMEIERDVWVRHEDGICISNLDGRIGKRAGVEAKFTALGREFGDTYSDDIPERIIIQAHHQMRCADLEVVYVPVLLARYDRPQEEMFVVERNEDLILEVGRLAHDFWHNHYLPQQPPPAIGPPVLDIVKRIKRSPGKIAQVDALLVENWRYACDVLKDAKVAEAEAKAALLAALGDAEIGDYGYHRKWLTYYTQNRAGYAVKPTSFPVARISKR